jgi:hypothetical protein
MSSRDSITGDRVILSAGASGTMDYLKQEGNYMETALEKVLENLQRELNVMITNCDWHRRIANESEIKAIQLKETIAQLKTISEQEGKK